MLGVSLGDDEEKTYFINPVYQDADGQVYATSGSGLTMDGDSQSEGSAFSKTLDETTTTTENGNSKKTSTSIKVSISTMLPPEKIVFLQMDENSSILSREEYLPHKTPDKLTPREGTAYIIVETHKRDSTGGVLVTRQLFGKDDETLHTFFCREDGICVERWTELIWKMTGLDKFDSSL